MRRELILVSSSTWVWLWCSGKMVTLGRSVYLPSKYMSRPGRPKFCAVVRPGFTLLSGIRPQGRHTEAVSGAEGGARSELTQLPASGPK